MNEFNSGLQAPPAGHRFPPETPPTTVWPKLKGQFYERPPAGSVEAAEREKKEAEELEKPRRRWGSKLKKKK